MNIDFLDRLSGEIKKKLSSTMSSYYFMRTDSEIALLFQELGTVV